MPNGETLRKIPEEIKEFEAPKTFKDRGDFYNWMANEIGELVKRGEVDPRSGEKAKERVMADLKDYELEVKSDERIRETIDAHTELLGFTSEEFFKVREEWKDLVNQAEDKLGLSIESLQGPVSLLVAFAEKARKGEIKGDEEEFVEKWRKVDAKYSEMVKKLIEDTDLTVV